MNTLSHFEQVGSRGFYRPVARVSFEQAIEMVAQAMRVASGLGLTDLLVNGTGLTGFEPPDVFARYQLAIKWTQSAANLRVAIVTRPENIDPQKIGMLMAENRGAIGDVFTTEVEALAWLDARQGLGPRAPRTPNQPRVTD